MISKLLPLATLVAILGVSVADAQTEKLTYGVFDMSGIVGPIPDDAMPAWRMPLRAAYRSREGDVEAVDDSVREVGTDYVLSFIRDTIEPESWELEQRQVRVTEGGTHLIVRQTPAVLEKIGKFLERYAAVYRHPVDLDLLVVEGDSASIAGLLEPGAVISAARFDALRSGQDQRVTVVEAAARSTLDGQRARLRAGVQRHFVGISSVEIASTAQIADPDTLRVFVGTDVSVRPTIMHGGRINLRIQADLSDRFELTEVETLAAGVGALQLPAIHVHKVTASAAVAPGEGLVVGAVAGGDGRSRYLVVRADTKLTEPVTLGQGAGRTRAFSVGYLTRPYLGVRRLALGWANGSPRLYDEWPSQPPAFAGDHWFMQVDEVHDLIRSVVTPQYWSDNLYRLESAAGALWVTAGPDQHRGVDRLLGKLTASRGRFVSLATYVVSMPAAALAAARAAGDDWLRRVLRSPDAYRMYTAVTTSEMEGRVELAAGREFAFLSDYSPAVAQGAAISEPQVETGFHGLYLRLAPYTLGASATGLHYHLELTAPVGPLGTFRPETVSTGVVQTPSLATREANGQVIVGPDGYALLAQMPSPRGDGEVAVVLTRLTD